MITARISYHFTLLLLVILVTTLIHWIMQLPENKRLVPFLLISIPLLPWIPGILKGEKSRFGILAFVSLLYLIHGSVEVWTSQSTYGLVEAVVAVLILLSSVAYIRSND